MIQKILNIYRNAVNTIFPSKMNFYLILSNMAKETDALFLLLQHNTTKIMKPNKLLKKIKMNQKEISRLSDKTHKLTGLLEIGVDKLNKSQMELQLINLEIKLLYLSDLLNEQKNSFGK